MLCFLAAPEQNIVRTYVFNGLLYFSLFCGLGKFPGRERAFWGPEDFVGQSLPSNNTDTISSFSPSDWATDHTGSRETSITLSKCLGSGTELMLLELRTISGIFRKYALLGFTFPSKLKLGVIIYSHMCVDRITGA